MNCIVCVACSPAQAAAAPAVMPEQSAGTAVLAGQYGGYAGRSMVDEHHMSSQMSCSPRVVCEPIRSDVKVHIASCLTLYKKLSCR